MVRHVYPNPPEGGVQAGMMPPTGGPAINGGSNKGKKKPAPENQGRALKSWQLDPAK
jgi:hypothetical protein